MLNCLLKLIFIILIIVGVVIFCFFGKIMKIRKCLLKILYFFIKFLICFNYVFGFFCFVCKILVNLFVVF